MTAHVLVTKYGPAAVARCHDCDLPDCLEVVQALSDIGATIDLAWTAEETSP